MYVRESTLSIAFGRGTEASPTFFTLVARDRAIRAKLGRAKEHVMRATEFERGEIQIKLRFQLFAVPNISADELLIVGAFIVPSRENSTGKIYQFSITVSH